jgi:cation diffusion facilitator family transporter
MSHTQAQKEKSSAALSSVAAAVGLTSFKIVVGTLTNSLGILAEAAHSGLDLMAALMTFFAVRMADKPADKEHNFGHGKVENLSALFETVLLLATSAWIIHEAIQRLFFKSVQVEASIWSFIVMGTSIAIDYTRSRILYRAAKKYNSQALEADALHFSTDIWSSAVVILGLIGVTVARFLPGLTWMSEADAVAALVVALIVIFISAQLGWRTIQSLLDAAPKGVADEIIQSIGRMKGVKDCHAVRIRPSGARWFVDLHVTMDGNTTLTEAHMMTERIEGRVRAILPESDVTVHAEPLEMAES